MLISIREIIDIILMSFAVGAIFAGLFPKKKRADFFTRKFGFSLNAFKYACLVTVPALVLHELGHKFVAIAFGYEAVFHAFYWGLLFGLIIRFAFGVVFFIPGYVSIPAMESMVNSHPLFYSAIAFAGPLANLAIWAIAHILIKRGVLKNPRHLALAWITKKINIILFLFNMLPIPPLDGWKFFYGLYHLLF